MVLEHWKYSGSESTNCYGG